MQCSDKHQVSETVTSIMAQNWSWDSQIAVKKKTDWASSHYFKVISFWKIKMKVLQNFSLWDQEIDVQFTNYKP